MQPTYRTASHPEQAQLLKRSQRGSKDAHNRLAEAVMPWALTLARRLGRDQLEDHDITSAAGFAVCYAIKRWNPAKGKLTTYLSYCVKREISRAPRKGATIYVPPKHRFPVPTVLQLAPPRHQPAANEPDDPAQPLDCDLQKQLLDAVKSLPPSLHQIIQLRFFADPPRTQRDIAEHLGISKQGVSRRQLVALKLLQKELQTTRD